MRRSKWMLLFIGILMVSLLLAACSGESSGEKDASDIEVVFIPKMTGNAFFESGNDGAQEMAAEIGFSVKYDGAPEGTVANQVQIINSAVNSGADAIAISSVTSDGLNQALQNAMDNDVKVVTWDSDVDPRYRTVYINQGTPEILGKMLVDMAAEQLDDPQAPIKFAFFYSSPTVPDQNAWVDYAKVYIEEEFPNWELVTTQFGEGNEQLSLQIGEDILNTYPDIDIILCPDSTALPAMAQAAENKGLNKDDVIITGFASPNSMREFIKNGTIENHGLWDVKQQGALAVYIAYYLAQGNELKVGDEIDVPGMGTVKVEPNSIQGYDYEAEDSGIILLPERIVFTEENTDDYNF